MRYERKFIINNDFNINIENIVKIIHGQFSPIYSSRYINNIYFDSIDLNNFHNNSEGLSKRGKTRIRWYNKFFGKSDQPTIELKEKIGVLVKNRLFKIPNLEIRENANFNIFFRKNIYKSLDKEIQIHLSNKIATVINRYNRKYFISKNNYFRITIDKNQMVANPNKIKYPVPLNAIYKNTSILELKYDIKHEAEARLITNDLPFRLNKNSKYVNSLKSIYHNY